MNRVVKEALHVAIFARAPVPGATKTRLIPLLGPDGAAHVHRQMLSKTLQTALQAADNQVSLWQAGESADAFLRRLADDAGLPCYRQTGTTLGTRMANCLQYLAAKHPAVVLIGSDAPVLSVQDFHHAAAALSNGARMVFSPAEDGGYVLVGAHQRASEAERARIFDAIDWGTSLVMSQTRERLAELGWRPGLEFVELATRWDVDEPADFIRAMDEGLLDWPSQTRPATAEPLLKS